MKRLIVAGSMIALAVLAPQVALAQEGSGLGPPEGPVVGGIGGSLGGAGGSAFTGAEVAGLIVAAVLLVVMGSIAVVLTRRHARATGS